MQWKAILIRWPDQETVCEQCLDPVCIGASYLLCSDGRVACCTVCAEWLDPYITDNSARLRVAEGR